MTSSEEHHQDQPPSQQQHEQQQQQQQQQEHIDALLQRYLTLLDEYTSLRTELSRLQTGMFQDLARANFAAERGMRYGADHYDERMRALRTLRVDMPAEAAAADFAVEAAGDLRAEGEAERDGKEGEGAADEQEGEGAERVDDGGETEKERQQQQKQQQQRKSEAQPGVRDPLRWFGLLTPPALRSAQARSVEAVERVIPRLASVDTEMAVVEIEVRRARKKRAKALAAVAGKKREEADTGERKGVATRGMTVEGQAA
ncbi:hypothetical protein JDV02_007498 [Purpureocillium takamizusanense]|uniref:Vacuolar ATPase assembly protein VMA22 n=1 Tax=Purpureocillium takamizusanense TaxID=2060973 RepID=A0A9Q8VCD4_9HYPO|nr:uncharacterized protein JDV02_007498 [Purpureocillium takamizusanense]UNI21515.1 hypothetical protein JDV02_007498 [Purpureocillium takamizusanense]